MLHTLSVLNFFVLGAAQFCPGSSPAGDESCMGIISGSRCQIHQLDENQREARRLMPTPTMGICSASGVNGFEVTFFGCNCDDDTVAFVKKDLNELLGPSRVALPDAAGFCTDSIVGDIECNGQVSGSRCRVEQFTPREQVAQVRLPTMGVCSLSISNAEETESRYFGCSCRGNDASPLPSLRLDVDQIPPAVPFTTLAAATTQPKFCPGSFQADEPCNQNARGSRCQIDQFDANQLFVRDRLSSSGGICSATASDGFSRIFFFCNCGSSRFGFHRIAPNDLPSPSTADTPGAFCSRFEGDEYCDNKVRGSRCQIDHFDEDQRTARTQISSPGICTDTLTYETEATFFGCNCVGATESTFTIVNTTIIAAAPPPSDPLSV